MIIRPAVQGDAAQMAEILNEIIEAGGTTAIENPVTEAELGAWMTRAAGRSVWTIAEHDGSVVGFQWVEPKAGLPADAGDIASFVRIGVTGLGVGGRMFEVTRASCKTLGYTWINAAIRSDNESGLRYYSRVGFRDWKTDPAAALSDGTVTGKTYKRFDL